MDNGSCMIRAEGMKLGDTVRVSYVTSPWNVAIVKQVTKDSVTLFRPYGATADFSYTGGVICYVGFEEYEIPLESDALYELLDRKELK